MSRKRAPLGEKRPSARRRRWIGVLAVSLAGTLLAAEGGLRLAARLMARGDPVRSRALAGARVIYCIGDSFTWGMGVRKEKAWPALLQGMLDARSVSKHADVNNLGFPGLSSTNALAAVARVIQQGDAGIILLMAGWNANDTDFIRNARERSAPVPLVQRIEDVLEASRLYRVLKQAATFRSRTLVLDEIEMVPQTEMEMYEFHAYQEIAWKNLERIAALCREFRVPLVLLNYPYRDLPPNEFSRNEYYHVLYGRTRIGPSDYIVPDRRPDEIAIHSVIRKVGEDQGVQVIDFQEAFAASNERPDRLFLSDYHHPSVVGHAIMARAIFDAIGSDLLELADAPPPPS